MNKLLPLSGLAASLCLLLSGCASLDRIDKIDKQVSQNEVLADKSLNTLKKGSVVRNLTSQWINPYPLNNQPGANNALPPCAVAINRPGSITLAEISAYISKRCRIPVVVTPDALAMLSSAGSGKTEQMSGPIPAPDPNGMIPLAGLGGSPTRITPVAINGSTLKGLFWQGEVGGVLDNVTTRLGVSYRFEQGRIAIFYLDTRSFPIAFQDSKTDFSSRSVYGASSGNSGGSGASTEGNSSQTTVTEMKTNRYKEIEDTVKSMLTPNLGRMSISTGLLTVTDTTRVLNTVQTFIEGRNTELTRQVALSVKVYSVTKKHQDQLGIDWDAVFKSGSVGLSLGNTMAGAASSAMTGGINILDGKFANSSAFIHALSQQANVSVVTQDDSTTMNMVPVRVQVVTQQDYISHVSTENTANVGSSTSVEKASISTGFNMTLQPYLQPSSDKMELQYSISLSDDPDMQSEKVGDVTLKLPKTKMHNFAQSTILHSGETLLLSGHNQLSNTVNRQGVGSSGFIGLGGGINGEDNKSMLLILITPVILG
jgi:type IVB pilus formation R64 PilN family outer membrane protein